MSGSPESRDPDIYQPRAWFKWVAGIGMLALLGFVMIRSSMVSPTETLRISVLPVLLFVGGLFGLDEYLSRSTVFTSGRESK